MGYNRLLSDALFEINTWLKSHPKEVLIVKFEDYLDGVSPISGELGRIVRNNFNTNSY
jgi:predicted translin family RNA/ssDNA-binding protein